MCWQEIGQTDYPEACQEGDNGTHASGLFVCRTPFFRTRELLRMRRVDQGYARNLVGVAGGIHLRIQSSKGVAYQHVGSFSVGALEQGMEFAGDVPGVPGFRTSLAPAHPRTVVGTHARALCELLLHPDPVGRHTEVGGFQDHRGATLSHAVDVHETTIDVHHFAGREIGTLVYLRGYDLVDGPYNCEREDPADEPHEPAPDPRSQPSLWPCYMWFLRRLAGRCFALHAVVSFLPASSQLREGPESSREAPVLPRLTSNSEAAGSASEARS